MGRNKKAGGSRLGIWLGVASIVGVCLLFFWNPAEGSGRLSNDEKDAKMAVRSLEEFAAALEDVAASSTGARKEEAAAFQTECSAYLADGRIEAGLQQRPKWVTALARRGGQRTSGEVLTMTTRSFFQEVAAHERLFVKFHSPTCTWCQKLAPTFAEAAKEAPASVTFASADTSSMSNISGLYDVTRLPTLLFFVRGRPQLAFLPNATKQKLLDYVTFRAESPLTPVTDEELQEILELPDMLDRPLFVGHGEAALETYEDMAESFRHKVVFTKTSGAEPSVQLFRGSASGGTLESTFTGPWTYDALHAWADQLVGEPKEEAQSAEL